MNPLRKNICSREELLYMTHPDCEGTETEKLNALLPVFFKHYTLSSKYNLFATLNKNCEIEIYPLQDNNLINIHQIILEDKTRLLRKDLNDVTLIKINKTKFKIYQELSSFLKKSV